MAVFDLVPEADQKLDVLALRRLSVAKVLSNAFSKVPVLRLAVDSHISDTGSWPAEPRAPAFSIEDRVENCGPSDVDEDNELRRPKAGAGSVIRVDSGYRCRATFFDVLFDDLR
jgi:hypothetical protein